MPVQELLGALHREIPATRLLTQPARLAPYESDALTAFAARPEAVVLADSREEVIELVRLCHREGVPFVARGSGTSLSGGSLPVEGGIVIGLNRLNRVLAVDPDERTAVVEPGVINQAVTRAAAPHGLLYAPDPSSQSICTIGGNIAFNSGGAHCLKHGMTSNHVLALEAVLPDGELARLGSGSVEPAAPDWLGLFVGSEGLFGIALEITLRLLAEPEATCTVLAAYPSLEAAGDAVAAIVSAGLLPVAIEIMDALAIRAAESSVRPGYPDAPALVIVELDGERGIVDADLARLREVIRSSGATEVRESEDATERATIWKGRKSAFSAVGWLAPDYLVQDGCVPRTRLGEALADIERLSAKRGLEVANVFHAGDGNLHPLILFDGREPGAVERAEDLAGEILELCVRLGGSITGEHGVGMEKRAHLAGMFGPDDIALMRRLRDAVDPGRLANRDKMLLTPPAAEVPSSPAAPGRAPWDEVRERFREARSRGAVVLARGAGTKPPLSTPPEGTVPLELSGLSGITRYDPAELTLTALAGTPVAEIEAELATHGQCLPFEPPLAAAGATLGGAIAAGASGPGRHRHGGVRDFVLWVRFLDGTGTVVTGGAPVVKNAAGFDLPKLMVGSLGRLGVLLEIAVKVFPAPTAWATLRAEAGSLPEALEAIARLDAAGIELEALDLAPPARVSVRIGGAPEALDGRLARIDGLLGGATERLDGAAEHEAWAGARELSWAPPGATVAKVAMRRGRVAALEGALERSGATRRYSAGGNLGWIAWPGSGAPQALDAALREADAPGVLLGGPPAPSGPLLLGPSQGGEFAVRAHRALDPDGAFAGGVLA